MKENIRILILEDSVDDVEFIKYRLKKENVSFDCRVVETRDYYERALIDFKPDVVLSDHSLPMFDSMLALQVFHSYKKIYHPCAAFILVTGTVSEEFAVRILKAGADDYILKDRIRRLPVAIENALQKNRTVYEVQKEEERLRFINDLFSRSCYEIFLVDTEKFEFDYVNPQALNGLGFSLDELKLMTPIEVFQEFEKKSFLEEVKRSKRTSKGVLSEKYAVRKDGSTYPVLMHLKVIHQEDREKALISVLDISEAKNA